MRRAACLERGEDGEQQRFADAQPAMAGMHGEIPDEVARPAERRSGEVPVGVVHEEDQGGIEFRVSRAVRPPLVERAVGAVVETDAPAA